MMGPRAHNLHHERGKVNGNYGAIFSNVISALDAVGVSLSDAPTQLGLAQSQLTATGTVVDNTGAMVVDLRKLDTALAARSTTACGSSR